MTDAQPQPRPRLSKRRIGVAWAAGVVTFGAIDGIVLIVLNPDPYAAFGILLYGPALLIAAPLLIWHAVSTVRRWDAHPTDRRRMALPLVVPAALLLLIVPRLADAVHDAKLCADEPTHAECTGR